MPPSPFGQALRHWRTMRRLSQLDVASRAQTPPRHVSFLETGRSRPSLDMVLRLADALDVPIAERNTLLTAAGFAPSYQQRALSDAALASVRFVIDRLLAAHAPYPALVLNPWYDIVDANAAARRLMLDDRAINQESPPNLIALLMGPMRHALLNWGEVALDTLGRLRREVAMAPQDERLGALLATVEEATRDLRPSRMPSDGAPVLCARMQLPTGVLSTLSTLVHFGSARDVTVHGLHVELIYPGDDASDRLLRALDAADASAVGTLASGARGA